MNKFKFAGLIVAVLFSVNLICHFIVQYNISKTQEKRSQVLIPTGKRFMTYCEGGTSNTLVDKNNKNCIADKPGVFFVSVVHIISIVFLFIILLILLILNFQLRKNKH